MKLNFFSSSSILKKFLVFNLIVFLFLGIFTLFYLNAIKPNLIKSRSNQHLKIINNTSDHIKRLNIEFTKKSMTNFLLSTRFLFQNLDRVQLYDLKSKLLADTDTLDLAQDIFAPNQNIRETTIDNLEENLNTNEVDKSSKITAFSTERYLKEYAKKNLKEKLVITETINNNFYVMTVNLVNLDGNIKGYIVVSEIANEPNYENALAAI